MSAFRLSPILQIILFLGGLLALGACGGGNSSATPPPLTPSYTLSAAALSPSPVTVGGTATSTIIVTPVNGYMGSVSLSCSSVTGGTPPPTCAFNPSTILLSGTVVGRSMLTVSTTGSPAATYTITVSAIDGKNSAPSNGAQPLTLITTAAPVPSYALSATQLNPGTVTAGGAATSTITVTPANGYTGSVTLSCSSLTGGTPAPTCAFNPALVIISGTAAGTSTLTVSTANNTPGGPYSVTVAASDVNHLAPSNGTQGLAFTTTAVALNVVIIFQENRTPDNLFQGLCLPPNSANACSTTPTGSQYNIQSFGINSTGQKITLAPLDLGTNGSSPDLYDLSHAHSAFEDMCDLDNTTGVCQMDGANRVPQDCEGKGAPCGPPNPQFQYVIPADVAPYLQMAQTYAFGDQMFQTNEGPSFPAHQFLIAGTSEPWEGSNLFVSENPVYASGKIAGCVAIAGTTVTEINPEGVEGTPIYPCMEHETLTDLFDQANPAVSWRYYAPSLGSIWTAPTAISHMCMSSGKGGTCTGPDYTSGTPPKVVVTESSQLNPQILTDIASNQLQQVSWVIPAGQFSDHPYINTGCGPSWVTQVVNAIGNSSYWNNTVIIVTWDDWGGWYDHVPPPSVLANCAEWGCGYVYGFRVPLLVISPYISKSGYISHTTHDFGSILRFLERNYGISEGALGVADAAATDNLSDFFNFSQSPIPFTPITAPSNTQACIGDTSPPSDPDDD